LLGGTFRQNHYSTIEKPQRLLGARAFYREWLVLTETSTLQEGYYGNSRVTQKMTRHNSGEI